MFEALLLLLSVTAMAYPDFESVRYIKNHDGDTITVDIAAVDPILGHGITVRVNGVDTPEMTSKSACTKRLAVKAREVVAAKLKAAKQIALRNPGRDKYFRILADVEIDGEKLSKTLLDLKLARPYSGGTKSLKPWCKD